MYTCDVFPSGVPLIAALTVVAYLLSSAWKPSTASSSNGKLMMITYIYARLRILSSRSFLAYRAPNVFLFLLNFTFCNTKEEI